MSDFLTNLVGSFTGSDNHSSPNNYSNDDATLSPPSQVPYPWRAQWDDRERRYSFVHEQTGEQIWDYDEVMRRTDGGEQSNAYNDQYEPGSVYHDEQAVDQSGNNHGLAYGALGAAAGLAGGAALMYEGEKLR